MRPELDDLKKSVGYMDRGLAWGWKGVEVNERAGRGWKGVEEGGRGWKGVEGVEEGGGGGGGGG